MCIKHSLSIALIRVLLLLCIPCVSLCVCLPLSVGHGLHEMRVKLVGITRLFLLKIKKVVRSVFLMENTTWLKNSCVPPSLPGAIKIFTFVKMHT